MIRRPGTICAVRRQALLLALLGAAAALPFAAARQNIRTSFFEVYPGALGTVLDSTPSRAAHCGVCHYDFRGGGPRNPYGVQVAAALGGFPGTAAGRRDALRSIELLDSDGDGFPTLQEITDAAYPNTPTFPGLRAEWIGLVSGVNVAEILAYLTPEAGGNSTPPAVTLLAPTGGELLTGNQPTQIEWLATDASGVAVVNLYATFDGLTYQPIARDLENSGSFNWFVPNRPTVEGRVLVEAIDFVGLSGTAASAAPFTIQAPLGGHVPTTLRDFDQPGSQPFDTDRLERPEDCRTCHGDFAPASEPYRTWAGSMMAHASRDPLFLAAMTIANQDAPDSGDVCLRCHLPAAWLEGRSVPTDGSAALPGDLHGVSCDLCHRMVNPVYTPGVSPAADADILDALADLPVDIGNGMYVVGPAGQRRGPYSDAIAPHDTVASPFHREAAFCGTCHDVSNPAFERDGSGRYVPNLFDQAAGSFSSQVLMPIERTYSEWLHSAYNSPEGVYAPQLGGNRAYVSTCQHCHMRTTTGRGSGVWGVPVRDDLAIHDLTGGSTWLPGLLPSLYPDEVDADAIADGILRARRMLELAAEVELAAVADQLRVTVINHTGHKLPTGYPEGRRIWINVRFLDAAGQLLAESCAYDPDTGTLSLDAQAKVYEAKPGLDELTAPLVGRTPGPSFHFVLNNKIFKDNRIPPRGFTHAAYEPFGGAPVGAAYSDGQFWDDTHYPLPTGTRRVEVRLFYQSTSREYVEFLRDENRTNTLGDELYALWADNGRCPPELMALAELELPSALTGDLNCDGLVNFDDIAPFVLAVTGQAAYEMTYPDCRWLNGDIDGSGVVDFDDINGFVGCLAGGGCF